MNKLAFKFYNKVSLFSKSITSNNSINSNIRNKGFNTTYDYKNLNYYSKFSFAEVKKKKEETKTSAFVTRPALSPSINNIDSK